MGLGNAEVTDHLITVSPALATMAASSSSVISMARLLEVAGRPHSLHHRELGFGLGDNGNKLIVRHVDGPLEL